MSLLDPSENNGGWHTLGETLRSLLGEKVLPDAPPIEPVAWECSRCEDAGYYVLAVPVHHPEFGRLQLCDCSAGQRQQRGRLARLKRLSGLDAYADKTFATFRGYTTSVQRTLLLAEEYAEAPPGWLALFGPYGCGKTHLAAAIAHTALARGRSVAFAAVPDLLDHLKASFAPDAPDTYEERFEQLRTVDLLILDDLGTESATPWAREKLYQLVNHRYVHKLPLVVTSNVAPETLDGRIYSRLRDRALGHGIVTLDAKDYRTRGA